MEKISHYALAALLLFGFSTVKVCGQSNAFNKEQALDLVAANAAVIGLSANDVKNVLVSDAYYDKTANVNLVYLQQTYRGVPVYNAIKTLAFRNGKALSVAGSFVTKLSVKANIPGGQPEIAAALAVGAAAKHVDHSITGAIVALSSDGGQKIEFPSYNVSKQNIIAKLLWVVAGDGSANLSWQIKFLPVHTSDYWLINVDARTGQVFSKDNLTVYDNWDKIDTHNDAIQPNNTENKDWNKFEAPENRGSKSTSSVAGSYRVIAYPAESPAHPGGAPQLVTDPFNNAGTGNPVAGLGWHNDGINDYNYTRGNNVWAKEDRSADNEGTIGMSALSASALPTLTFDFPLNDGETPTNANNTSFANTQLFYWNNIMHDLIYQYGFDEVSGNFQNDNIGRGGLGNDYVNADAQDGSGTNNANFSTPDDGSNPRMQMYLFNARPIRTTKVNAPASIAAFKSSAESNVSAANKLAAIGGTGLTANVSLYGTLGSNFGCTALNGTPLSGKIALIDQTSTCTFPVQIKNAQLAGAVGVVVMKSTTGTPVTMTGTDNTITIPAVMVTQADGQAMHTALQNGEGVNVTLKASVQLDGDLDNGIIGHEYAHGISNRLTGGPSISSCLTNKEQMGEGWSDYYALMTTTNWQTAQVTDGINPRPVGTYVFADNITSPGIRIYPYTTNQTINPWSYGRLASQTNGEVHNIGEIWTAVLWDMTWNLIQANGINPDMYNANSTGGNSVALKLVTEGMKLQSCRPGFLDGRDGILKADTLLYNGQYSCLIWKSFAGRGMGIKAKQGSSDSYTDQTSDFTLPDAVLNKTVDKSIADQNQQITYTLKVTCRCTPISNYKIVDTIDTNLVDYVSGGTYDAAMRTVTFNVPSLTEGQSTSFNFTVKIKGGTYTAPATPLSETVTSTSLPTTAFAATATGSGAWSVSNAQSSSGPNSFKASDPTTTSKQTLTSLTTYPVNGISTLSFYHYYNTEAFYDGGIVELSTNGITWFDAGPYMYENGYNSQFGTDSKSGFAGNSNQFIETKINLSSFSGKLIKIRFVFASDAGVGGDGWYVDDITLKNEAGVYNVGRLYNNTNQLVNISDTATLITNLFPLTWGSFTAQKDGRTALLKWTTVQEHSTAQFMVERSTDGTHYESIGTVRAAGNSNTTKNYNLLDGVPANGINYYRIRQVDNDGHFTYSETRSLTFDKVNPNISISPNPAKDKIAITIPGNKKQLRVAIFSIKGEKVGSFMISGEYSLLNLPGYPPAVYYLNITGDDVSFTQKIIIE